MTILTGLAACTSGGDPVSPAAVSQAGVPSASRPAAPPDDRFDGSVGSVDTGASSLTLADGQVVLTDSSTKWKSGGSSRLASLVAVADAIGAGLAVRAKGKGAVTATGEILASEIDARTSPSQTTGFGGRAATAVGDTLTLDDGTVVSVNAATRWKQGSHRLQSVLEVAEALVGGVVVKIRGKGIAQGDGSLLATEIDARVAQSAVSRFAALGVSVDLAASTILLADGTVVTVLGGTQWKDGPKRLTSLVTLAEALDSGMVVMVKGKGAPDPAGTVAATEIDARAAASAMRRFKGFAAAVDPVTGTVDLLDGTRVATFAGTVWKTGGRRLTSLVEIDAALAAAELVAVKGKGTAQADGSIVALEIRARVKPASDDDDDSSDDTD